MPPKKQQDNKKAAAKHGAKMVEDKTFGLKNKNKSKKVQQFVQSVKAQVHSNLTTKIKSPDERAAEEARKLKLEKEKMEKELAMLYRQSIKQPKLEAGVDPKSVVCEFFKQGVCDKGAKCKFGHDLTLGRKSAKMNLYADRREGEGEDGTEKKDDIADWDQSKLESVVKTKHGAEAGAHQNKITDIVCKYFLDAIEKELYGWFWVCPNGGSECKYRHALPPGYVFKTKKERDAEAAAKLEGETEEVDIGEIIEAERARLPSGGTKITAETFKAWKTARDARKVEAMKHRQEDEAKKGHGGGRDYKVLSGRALFTFDPSLFVDDADAAEDLDLDEDDDEEDGGAGGGAYRGAGGGGGGAGGDDEEEEDEEEEDGEENDEDDDDEGGAGDGGGDDDDDNDDGQEDEEEEEEEDDGAVGAGAGGGAGGRSGGAGKQSNAAASTKGKSNVFTEGDGVEGLDGEG